MYSFWSVNERKKILKTKQTNIIGLQSQWITCSLAAHAAATATAAALRTESICFSFRTPHSSHRGNLRIFFSPFSRVYSRRFWRIVPVRLVHICQPLITLRKMLYLHTSEIEHRSRIMRHTHTVNAIRHFDPTMNRPCDIYLQDWNETDRCKLVAFELIKMKKKSCITL